MNNDYAGRSILEAARKGITLCVAAALILPPALPPAMSSPQVTHCLAPDSYFRNGHQVSSDERDREIERVIDKAEWFIMKKRFAGNAYRELVALRDKYFAAPPADERSRRILSGLDSMIKSASFLKGKQVKVIEADRKVREFAPGLEKLLSERDALAKRNAELEAAVRAAGDESRGMSTALDVVHRHLQLQSDRLKLGGEDGCAGEMVRISEQFPKFEPIPADLKALERDIAIVSERLDAYARSPAAGQIGHPKLKEENQRAVKSFLKLLGEAAANARRFAELSPKASRAPAALAMNKRRISELDPQISKVKGEEQTFRQILLSAESAFDEQAKKWFAADLLRMRKELMLGAGAGAVTVVSAFGMGGTISGEDALFYLTQKTGKQKRMPLADLAKDMGTAIGKNSAQLLSAVDVIVDETTDAGYHARGGRTAFEV
ncbi:MAG TPA: hypothetical protein P5287_07780, partial [bacterium]|nr:hypothetical protein [bacterium]